MLQKQILIVEDNELNREILKEILNGEYHVLEAENGLQALDILSVSKDHIALILLDVMMPVMDGYAFLNRVKKDPELALIPVIVMTQSDSEADEVAALAHGATDFVPKPYRPQVILHRVASIIKLRETAAMVNQFQFDRLTGLYSKEFFYRKAREWLDENPDREYTIICSNIENFKLYNDYFGIPAGDRLLQEVAAFIQEGSGENAIFGRFGADRFMCMQEQERERKDRSSFLEKYIPKIKNVVMKWGVYEISDRSVPVEQMCDRALLAADSIKGQYNRHIAVYDEAMRAKLLREKTITDAMENALAEGQFQIYLQPKYSLKENRLAGAEALVRWIHPEWGFLSPGEFIPLFEKNGFITRLDQYVWGQVCTLLRDWKRKGCPILPISVNVSRADVYQLDLVDTLREMTQSYGVDPECLNLEITESAYSENPSQIISTVDRLRKLGFTVEMDDFGSGYSSLNMLNQMKLDVLKLDMNFIRNEIAKPTDQSILNYIISMAHWLGLSVVAEGIETRYQMERMREVGCDYVQGYYFAKPMPAREFEELLLAQPYQKAAKTVQRNVTMRQVLVVDEDSGFRQRVREVFQGKYQLLEASDADGALSCIAEFGGDALAAVILSMTLPRDNAAAFLKAMRKDTRLWSIPVLATIPGPEMMEQLPLAQETDDFLCKCHPPRDLLRRIERLAGIAASRERGMNLCSEAGQDYLTGLLNRQGFQTALTALHREDLPVAVYLFDLDGLKAVNDTFGHEVGDQIIQSFADLLRRQTCGGDILCRYGGDEFVVAVKHQQTGVAALNQGERICRLFREDFASAHFHASCSGGVVMCGADEKPSARLIEYAHRALYQAKRECTGGCCLWSGEAGIPGHEPQVLRGH